MKIPVLRGIIRRRILLNYRVAPEVAQELLPKPFRPKLVDGYTVAGICLIRLEKVRPKGAPFLPGIASENSAHRFAVEWDEAGTTKQGVFVPRRDTNSLMNSLAGGRIFPGVHHHSSFTIQERDGRISMQVDAQDEVEPLLKLKVSETDRFPETSVFGSLAASSEFFERGSIGYSARPDSPQLDGLQLKVSGWQVSPLKVDEARSSFFDDRAIFPEGSVELDHALLMRDIRHEWHTEPSLH